MADGDVEWAKESRPDLVFLDKRHEVLYDLYEEDSTISGTWLITKKMIEALDALPRRKIWSRK